jgi:hypothetical protein
MSFMRIGSFIGLILKIALRFPHLSNIQSLGVHGYLLLQCNLVNWVQHYLCYRIILVV